MAAPRRLGRPAAAGARQRQHDTSRGAAMVTPLDEAPPRHDNAAERQVLGAILATPAALDDVRRALGPDDFWRPAHSVIYLAALGLADRGIAPEPVAVYGALRNSDELERVGGAPYLHGLLAG